MEQKLYDLMDWAGIEELTYSESADPHRMLGPHVTEEGLLIQAFIPTATAITVKLTGNGKKYPMELADEAGFYAVLIPRKTVTAYTLLVTYDNGTEEEIHDPYSFGPQFTEEELKKFHPSLEVEDAEDAIFNQDLTDMADILIKMIDKMKPSEE